MTNVVEMKKITKIFPGVIANEDVDFNLRKGEIHVLLGENGAGKTTLMNVLYGLYKQESGEIFINGKLAEMRSPSEAIANGIGMVHQHFMLVQNFTVAENIVLGDEPKKGLKVDYKKAREKVQELADRYDFKINADDIIEEMTVGQQQKVEILKALYRKAEILILDEPTAVLTPQEIDELAVILRNLTDEGKSIILITHKLKEIMIMSDRVTIIRRGKSVGTVETLDTDIDKLAELMVGRKVNLVVSKEAHESKGTILKVQGVEAVDMRGVQILKGISFDVKRGEIFGLAGVDGNGQTELVEVLT
ncbi:MAG: ATP-binding cassette domain-containing protein, partial [Clostridium sp.]|nr:ATP-binding cassette domain-containing protein [Clostridium sp.]